MREWIVDYTRPESGINKFFLNVTSMLESTRFWTVERLDYQALACKTNHRSVRASRILISFLTCQFLKLCTGRTRIHIHSLLLGAMKSGRAMMLGIIVGKTVICGKW